MSSIKEKITIAGLSAAATLALVLAWSKYQDSLKEQPKKKPVVEPKEEDVSPPQENDGGPEEIPGSPVVKPAFPRARRGGVSSEATVPDPSKVIRRVIHKSVSDLRSISAAVKKNILFQGVDEEARDSIFEAMFEKQYKKDDTIIKQGDDGDFFYVIEEGEVEITQIRNNEHVVLVPCLGKGGSFGELALIYNAPRAATVRALTDCKLWALERSTYRQILMVTTIEKRKLYESFLEAVPILQDLNRWEKMTVADALESVAFEAGEVILREGEPGERFYIIVEGEAKAYRHADNQEKEIGALGRSNYFGEIALLMDRPRAATVKAVSAMKCVTLDRDCFKRVLGPCEDILRRNMVNYNRYMTEKI
eukprot:TRINITY_DN31267_c0_g1_i1.p1 TRINITY_DN31267_c0_g1~~TRINITY_DN31267_c0_g1_i1.p1  ORF type:complete len:364 (-),score=98.26 TRINITY_DN31267_c0_g1_i1:245-1336(-)